MGVCVWGGGGACTIAQYECDLVHGVQVHDHLYHGYIGCLMQGCRGLRKLLVVGVCMSGSSLVSNMAAL